MVMNAFKAAQPALLYLVPFIIGALAVHAGLLKSFKEVCRPALHRVWRIRLPDLSTTIFRADRAKSLSPSAVEVYGLTRHVRKELGGGWKVHFCLEKMPD